MKYAIKSLSFSYICFVAFLSLSGSISGVGGEVIYYLAFLLPLALGVRAADKCREEREAERGVAEPQPRLFTLSKEGISVLALSLFPAILLIIAVSLLTGLLLGLFGIENSGVEIQSLPVMLLIHALIPCITEELLFRYLPMRLLMPYSKRWCIIYSSVFFALVHCNLFQIPYALVAGLIFITLDIMYESVIPSLVLHFLNNAASVINMKYCQSEASNAIYLGIIILLAVISLVGIIAKRDRIKLRLKSSFEKGESTSELYPVYVFVALTLVLSFVSLL